MTLVHPEVSADTWHLWQAELQSLDPRELCERLKTQIMLEASLAGLSSSDKRARDLLTFMQTRVLKQLRRSSDGVYHMREQDLRFHHDLLEIIMPDDQLPSIGSAQAMLNLYLGIDPGYSLVHTKVGEVVQDCAVVIALAHA